MFCVHTRGLCGAMERRLVTPRPKSPGSVGHGDIERTEEKLCVVRACAAE